MAEEIADSQPMPGIGQWDWDALVQRRRTERRDAAEHRRHILETARDLFEARGVDAVSMHQIAQAAGVGQGTLYRRYAHKGQLCMDLLADSVESLRADFQRLQDAPEADATSPIERIGQAVDRLISFNEHKAPILNAVCVACGKQPIDLYTSPPYVAGHNTISALLEEAIASGLCRPVDVPFTADAILNAVMIDLYLYQREKRGYSVDRIRQAVRSLFIDGLKVCPASESTATPA